MPGLLAFQRISDHEFRGECHRHPDFSCTASTYEGIKDALQKHEQDEHPEIKPLNAALEAQLAASRQKAHEHVQDVAHGS